jgi:hypothetical protein
MACFHKHHAAPGKRMIRQSFPPLHLDVQKNPSGAIRLSHCMLRVCPYRGQLTAAHSSITAWRIIAMEHRWSRRNPVCLDAFVFHRLCGLIPANILDISLEGVFIAVEHPALPAQAMVELSFAVEIAGKQTIQQMQAFVIHRSRNGYGLMFKDFRRSAFQALAGTLNVA